MKQTLLTRLRRWANGDPLAFRSVELDEDMLGRIRAVQINAVKRNSAPMMIANAVNAITLLVAMQGLPYQWMLEVWCFVVVGLSSFIILRRRGGLKTPPTMASVRGIRRACLNSFLFGTLWGLVPATLFVAAPLDSKLVIICLAIGMLCGGCFALSTIPVAAVSFTAPIIIGTAYAIAQMGGFTYILLAVLLISYSAVLLVGVSAHAMQLAMRVFKHARDEAAAYTDSLTHLPNRVAFRRHLTEAFARSRRFGESFALFCFDLDNFKIVNDTMGHSGGDRVLVEVARRLRVVVREVDIAARLAGDEFALIASHVESEEQASVLARRINSAFQEPFDIGGKAFICTISIGIAFAPADAREIDILMRYADAALYATKQRGRGGFSFYNDRSNAPKADRLRAELKRAISNRELQLYFQPTVALVTQRVTGFEALLRWNHPERGLLAAAEIIPLAEEAGLMEEIGAWVLRESVRIASGWPPGPRVIVNVSAHQLRSPLLAHTLQEVTAGGRFPPERIEFDVTEAAVLRDNETARQALQDFRRLGIRIALDDFGAGLGSLTHMIDLPIDRLKIDRSFVANALAAPACGALVRAIVTLAHDLNLALTAEGVETVEQFAFLKSIGCEEAQGYFFSRPKVAAELDDLIEEYARREAGERRGKLKAV